MPSLPHTILRFSATQTRFMVNMGLRNVGSLRRILEVSALPLAMPAKVAVEAFQIGALSAEWLRPEGADLSRVLLFLHGGGYVVGSIKTHRSLAAHIAQEVGIQALIIDYRLAPEHPFPAALEDAVTAYQWLLDQGYAPEHLLIGGDSAGGGLTVATQVMMRKLEVPLPAGSFCISPWVDLSFGGDSARRFADEDPIVRVKEVAEWGKAYAGNFSLHHPMVSPLFADLSGLPPLLIQASDREVLTDDAVRLATRLKRSEVEVELQLWPRLMHVWQLFWRVLPEAQEAISHLTAFASKQLGMERSPLPSKKPIPKTQRQVL